MKLFVYFRKGNLVHRADTGWDNMLHIKGVWPSHTQNLTAFIGSMGGKACYGCHT